LDNGLQRLAQNSASNETPFEFIKTERYIFEIRLTEVQITITGLRMLPVRKKPLFRGNLNPPECRARHLTNTPRVRGDKASKCKVTKQIKTTLIKKSRNESKLTATSA